MARVKNLDQITGNLKNLSFYTRKGSDGIIVRTKGGATKEKIKRDPAFAGLRKANKEFGGCSKMGKQIRMAFYGLEHVADYNLSAVLNRLAKDIQKTDTLHPVGERDMRFSAYRFLLKGFDFSRTTRFASLLRVPLAYTLVRQRQEAVLQIPAFACSFGLNMPDTRAAFSYFRITAALGIVTDMALNPLNQGYEPVHDKLGQGYLVIHFYKTLSKKELRPIESGLARLGLKIPVVVVTVNKSFSQDVLAFDTDSEHLMPLSYSYIPVNRTQYLLFNNSLTDDTSKETPRRFPFPMKVSMQYFAAGSEVSTQPDPDMRVELLSQICSFSQLYWKSVSSQSLPVTVKYPEMLAQIVPNFSNAEIPGAGRERLWFL